MKQRMLLFLFTLTFFTSFAQTNTLDSAWIRDNYYKWERMIPMRDGKKLFTAIYIPKVFDVVAGATSQPAAPAQGAARARMCPSVGAKSDPLVALPRQSP